MSTELRWIRGASPRPRYVGYGRPWPLYRCINDLQGIRALIERIAVPTVGRLAPRRSVRDPTIQDAWQRLNQALPGITSALLVNTSFYKNTLLSGVITAQQPLFVKVFATLADQEAEGHRLHDLRRIMPSGVVLAGMEFEGDGVIAYELLERSGRRASQSVLEGVAVELGMNSYRVASRSGDSAGDAWNGIVQTTSGLLAKFGVDIAGETASRLRRLDPPRTIAHGDFTPWNTFLSRQDQVAVVDYERVGRRAPFTDAWHLTTQPLALRGRAILPSVLLARVRDVAKSDDPSVFAWYCAYLLEELNQDASDWVLHGRHHPQLRRLILTKTRLLEDAILGVDAE